MKIVCSRQVFTEQTKICLYRAPVGANKSSKSHTKYVCHQTDLVFAAVHVYVVVAERRFRLDSDHVPLPSASSSLSSSELSPQFTG